MMGSRYLCIKKVLCGLTTWAIGASVGSSADLALICMQADATLPAAQRRNYTNAFNALYRIIADEGVKFWHFGKVQVQFPDSLLLPAVCLLIMSKPKYRKCNLDASGKYPYTGSLDCTMKTLKSGGPLKFYTGFSVYCVRIAPHVMMTWIFLSQIQKLEKSISLVRS
ncbi:hypothetical protein IFM89_013576 [Coptis chinensis]|uniref:Uncharacterized protein n=1 Tax=Coptis chinensis TaxID=261450 RepID=A0A835I297_9MAGN|nr:hypothetical protein IFM89_013576 [Coptis chinensis]